MRGGDMRGGDMRGGGMSGVYNHEGAMGAVMVIMRAMLI